jgi:23S rRNA (guanosine2251-2'-O)-methyltransferase
MYNDRNNDRNKNKNKDNNWEYRPKPTNTEPPREKTNRPQKTNRIQYDSITPSDKKWDESAERMPVDRDHREGSDFIYGRHPVLEGLKRGDDFEKIMLLQGTRGEFEKEVRHLCGDRNIPLQIVPKEKLQTYTQNNHQGVIAITSPIAYQELETVYAATLAAGKLPLFILLDGVTDVRNIGAIARSAEISGAQALVVSKKNVAAINGEAIKTSAGALSFLPVCRVSSLMTAVDFLQTQGAQVIATDMEAKKQLRHIDFSLPTAIVMGAEGRGINNDLLKQINHTFKIPMLGKTDSFNVSVATGIVLYESMRQRGD